MVYKCNQLIFLCLVFLATSFLVNSQILEPQSLTISEGFKNPMGFYNSSPTFSWKLPVGIDSQKAYNIVVASSPKLLPNTPDLWHSGKVNSNQTLFVKYQGKDLKSRQKVYWQVQYFDKNGNSSRWSEVAHFELGLLKNNDWKAKWTGLNTAKDSIKGVRNFLMHRPQYLRKEFELASKVESARLYITAKGVFDVHLNGKDVSDDLMPPGWTPYNKRIETFTYDVTNLLTSGKNAIAVELASGWHSGRISRGTSFI